LIVLRSRFGGGDGVVGRGEAAPAWAARVRECDRHEEGDRENPEDVVGPRRHDTPGMHVTCPPSRRPRAVAVVSCRRWIFAIRPSRLGRPP